MQMRAGAEGNVRVPSLPWRRVDPPVRVEPQRLLVEAAVAVDVPHREEHLLAGGQAPVADLDRLGRDAGDRVDRRVEPERLVDDPLDVLEGLQVRKCRLPVDGRVDLRRGAFGDRRVGPELVEGVGHPQRGGLVARKEHPDNLVEHRRLVEARRRVLAQRRERREQAVRVGVGPGRRQELLRSPPQRLRPTAEPPPGRRRHPVGQHPRRRFEPAVQRVGGLGQRRELRARERVAQHHLEQVLQREEAHLFVESDRRSPVPPVEPVVGERGHRRCVLADAGGTKEVLHRVALAPPLVALGGEQRLAEGDGEVVEFREPLPVAQHRTDVVRVGDDGDLLAQQLHAKDVADRLDGLGHEPERVTRETDRVAQRRPPGRRGRGFPAMFPAVSAPGQKC